MLLELEGLSCHYGRIQALRKVTLNVAEGELVSLVGANGAGKTTLMRCVSGILPASAGAVRYDGSDITRLSPDRRVRLGIVQIPEGRQVFAPMSVEENLLIGGYTRNQAERAGGLEAQYAMFPVLREMRTRLAGALSGGQQQMLVIARALMAEPRLLLLDEPSLGLAPRLVDEVFETIGGLRQAGVTVFVVEQNAFQALSIADRGYVMETGRIAMSGRAEELIADKRVREAYLGI